MAAYRGSKTCNELKDFKVLHVDTIFEQCKKVSNYKKCRVHSSSKGAVLVTDNRVFNGPLGRSLRSFARTAHSAHSLRSAPLRYARFATLASLCSLRSLAPFTGSLTHFAHSLVGQLKFMNMCSRWKRVSWEQSRFLSSVETHPWIDKQRLIYQQSSQHEMQLSIVFVGKKSKNVFRFLIFA